MSDNVPVQIVQLPHAKDLPLPEYATTGSAAMDLYAAVDEPVTLYGTMTTLFAGYGGGYRSAIPCGISIAIPEGHAGLVLPRSGMAIKHGIGVANSPGLIDSDYRGEVKVILINHGAETFTVERGMRIAQLIITPFARVQWHPVDTLDDTERGSGGLGSTGE